MNESGRNCEQLEEVFDLAVDVLRKALTPNEQEEIEPFLVDHAVQWVVRLADAMRSR